MTEKKSAPATAITKGAALKAQSQYTPKTVGGKEFNRENFPNFYKLAECLIQLGVQNQFLAVIPAPLKKEEVRGQIISLSGYQKEAPNED